jgi:hypothetical protein
MNRTSAVPAFWAAVRIAYRVYGQNYIDVRKFIEKP